MSFLFPFFCIFLVADFLIPAKIPIGFVLIMGAVPPLLYNRSNWFQILPMSRKRLIAYHIQEMLVIGILNMLSIALILAIHYSKNRFEKADIAATMLCCTFAVLSSFLSLFSPIKRAPTQRDMQQQMFFRKKKMPTFRDALLLLCICLFIYLIFNNAFEGSWILVGAIFIGMMILILIMPVISIAMPIDSANKWTRFCRITAVIFVSIYLASEFSVIYFGNPESNFTKVAYDLLGNFPIPIPESRLLSLARIPNGVESPHFSKITQARIAEISNDEWTKRTAACKSDDCIGVSDLLIPESLTKDQKIERFLLMIGSCSPEFQPNGLIRCKGLKIPRDQMNVWLDFLFRQNIAKDWLESSDVFKQYLAIRSFACRRLDSEIEGKIRALESSTNNSVNNAARLHMSYYFVDAEGKSKFNCPKLNRGDFF